MLRSLNLPRFFWLMLFGAVLATWFQYVPATYILSKAWQGAIRNETRGLGLDSYHVTIDALPIAGVSANASGLAFNEVSGTLFMAINSPPAVVELTTEGKVIRKMRVEGIADLEGIAYLGGQWFALADERRQRIVFVEIAPEADVIDALNARHLALALDLDGNRGFEGLAWDKTRQVLLVAKEKAPKRVLEIAGLMNVSEGFADQLDIREWKPSREISAMLRDLSSLSIEQSSGHLLLLSDEFGLMIEYDRDGEQVGSLALWRGQHGLAANVPQAEGVEFDGSGNLYLVSEPNLFYRFSPGK